MAKELIYSLTKKDFIIRTFRGSGPGGQKRNKTDSGVSITHPSSGAIGRATEDRSQHRNKRVAFQRMYESKEFQLWHRMKLGETVLNEELMKQEIEHRINEWMKPKYLREEYF
jgi:protein subunit release factor B